jgi:hypothetical protein
MLPFSFKGQSNIATTMETRNSSAKIQSEAAGYGRVFMLKCCLASGQYRQPGRNR